MFLPALLSNPILSAPPIAFPIRPHSLAGTGAGARSRAGLRLVQLCAAYRRQPEPVPVLSDSLRLLEWDKVCDSVSSFAGTHLGREASKEQLWSTNVNYEESKMLLSETAAGVQLIEYGAGLDFTCIDTILVKSAIGRVKRGLPLYGIEAMAVVTLIQFAETLQMILKAALKEDANWYNRFMPLTQVILDFVISLPFVKLVQQQIDEDGSVKDSASSELKRCRNQVRVLEGKLYQLMDKLIRNDKNEASSLEVCNVSGRWCIRTMVDQFTAFEGLLLSSGSGVGCLVEPTAAVSLNDELQQARVLVNKAEEEVLSRLTDKMLVELDDIQSILHSIVRLDVITARARYSIAYGGTFPDLSLPSVMSGTYTNEADNSLKRTFSNGSFSHLPQRDWKLYMPKAYHPLLLKKHREKLQKARKNVADATSEIRRKRLQWNNVAKDDDVESHLESLRLRVSELENSHPTPVDFMISANTGVLVITGPNTGGKTISLKTVGLASLMAKTGVYVLASEPVKIPWFDATYVDIGDEQSLAQSLSTFSGHLKQIGAIHSQSTNKSLVLLDEVGAGTNPLEGAALGMSILEYFSQNGSYLTIATTHHGELKTLKYCKYAFENACVEFDEESLKPTYKILWGIPGRSNAINVAEKIGLPHDILDKARKLHGTSSAEINGVIVDMETCKQKFQQHVEEAQHYLMQSRKLREDLVMAKKKLTEHRGIQRHKKTKIVLDIAAIARSTLRSKLQKSREPALLQKTSTNGAQDNSASLIKTLRQSSNSHRLLVENPMRLPSFDAVEQVRSSATGKAAKENKIRIPEVGETVFVPSLKKQATVLKVEESKGDVLVQASNIKLRLKLKEVDARQTRTA